VHGKQCSLTSIKFDVRLFKTGVWLSRSGIAGSLAMSNGTGPVKTSCYFIIANERIYSELKCNWHKSLSAESKIQGSKRTDSRSQWPRGLRRGSTAVHLLRSWVEIPPGHGCLFVVTVVCCQVEVSATSWSLFQRSPTECCLSLCVIYEGWNFNSGNYLFTTDTK